MKQLLQLFITGALVSLGGLIQAQSTHYVNPDGNCEGKSPCYTTIQASVNAATAGDIIQISAGTFTEKLDINKDLTLKGSGNGVTNVLSQNIGKESDKIVSVINAHDKAHVIFVDLTVTESTTKLGNPGSGASPSQ